MNTQYRKNLKAVLEASKTYCDESIDSLRWELGTYDLSVDSDTTTAHIKTLPSGTIQTTVSKVEGVGYKVNQLVKELNSTNWSAIMSTATFSDGVATFTATAQNGNINQYLTSYLDNHKYLAIAQVKLTTANTNIRLYGNGGYLSVYSTATTDWQVLSKIFTGYSSEDRAFNIRDTRSSDWDAVQVKNAMLFDLTADFGSGNEPNTVSDCATAYLSRGINIYEYTPQQSSIKNNAFTGAKVEGTNKYDYGTSADYTMNGGSVPTSFDFNNHVKVKIGSGAGTYCINNTKYKGGTYALSFTYTSVQSATPRTLYRFYDISGNILSNLSISGLTWNNYYQAYYSGNTSILLNLPSNVAYFNIGFGGSDAVGEYITYENVMLNSGSTALDYIPYTSQTLPIDLTTIKDSNNVSLFPSGKMMGNSSVADFITPYNQESRYNEVDLSQCNWSAGNYGSNTGWYTDSVTDIKTVAYDGKFNGTCEKYEIAGSKGVNLIVGVIMVAYGTQRIWVGRADGDTTNRPTGILQYERATYLTSTTDLTSLARINAESNGTITLNNTDNVDMPNTIDYLIEEVKA